MSNHPKAPDRPNREQLEEIAKGLGVTRKLIFSAPVSMDGWHREMLKTIQVAKKLGFTLFEIDVPGTVPVAETKKPEATGMIYVSFFGPRAATEGDEWKVEAEEKTSNEKKRDVPVVSVWAIVVEAV